MAPHTLSCPECDHALRLPAAAAPGKRLRCPRCRAVFEVPDEEDEGPRRKRSPRPTEEDNERVGDARGEDEPSRRRRRKSARRQQKASSGAGLAIGLIVGGVLLVLLVVGGAGVALYRLTGAGAPWQEFAPPGGGFSVLMPGTPAPMSAPPAPAPGLEVKKYRGRVWGEEFVVGYCDVPAETLQRITAESIFQAERDAVVQGVRGRVVSEKDITLAGQAGREYQFAPGDGKGLVVERVYLVRLGGGLRFYSLGCAGPALRADSPDLQKFFDSFRLTDAAGGGRGSGGNVPALPPGVPPPGGVPAPGAPMPPGGLPGMPRGGPMPGVPPGGGVPGRPGR